MTYFPVPSVQSSVKVSHYRDAIGFAQYCATKVQSPGCLTRELIRERANLILCLFRAMRDLQSISCKRASQRDRDDYDYVFNQATRLIDEYKSEYFEYDFEPCSTMTDEQLYAGWIGSRKADQLTYITHPQDYPAQAEAVLRELKGLPAEAKAKDNVIAFPGVAIA